MIQRTQWRIHFGKDGVRPWIDVAPTAHEIAEWREDFVAESVWVETRQIVENEGERDTAYDLPADSSQPETAQITARDTHRDDDARIASEVEVWIVETPVQDGKEQPWKWGIRLDGVDHGGGWTDSQHAGLYGAADYVRDLEIQATEEAEQV
jgi:hypothetical protein